MSGHNLTRTLPPGDRTDAPDAPSMFDHHEEPIAPPTYKAMTDLVDAERMERLDRFLTAAREEFDMMQRARVTGDWARLEAHTHLLAQLLTDLGPLARLVERAVVMQRPKTEPSKQTSKE